MTEETIFLQIARYGVVPVVAIEDVAQALPLADALLAVGLPVLEVTFRTAAAAEALRVLHEERPHLLAGAGTVLTPENLAAARESGAAFAIAPGVNPAIVRQARESGLPFVPGVATPSEIETALGLGCRLLKFFPAEALGGVPMLEALSAPYRHTGVHFMPTGGITPENLESYLKLDFVSAAGGTWLAKSDDLRRGNWDAVRTKCRAALERVAAARAHRFSK